MIAPATSQGQLDRDHRGDLRRLHDIVEHRDPSTGTDAATPMIATATSHGQLDRVHRGDLRPLHDIVDHRDPSTSTDAATPMQTTAKATANTTTNTTATPKKQNDLADIQNALPQY